MRQVAPVWVSELPTLDCPWCGLGVAPGTEWAVQAGAAWGWCGFSLTLEGRVVGVILLGPTPSGQRAFLHRLWVAPDQVGQGVGRQLVTHAAAGLKAAGIKELLARGAAGSGRCQTPGEDFLRKAGFSKRVDSHYWVLPISNLVEQASPLLVRVGRWARALRPVRPASAGGTARVERGEAERGRFLFASLKRSKKEPSPFCFSPSAASRG